MAAGTGTATLSFPASAQAAQFRSDVVVSDTEPNPSKLFYDWQQQALPVTANWSAIAWNGSVFCAVGYGSNIAATSPDGITWTQQTLPASANWYAIALNGSMFFTVTYGSNIAATSSDGLNWTQQALPSSANWSAISRFCIVSYGSNIVATLHFDTDNLPNTRTINTVNTEIAPAAPIPGTNQTTVTVTGLTGITANAYASAWIVANDSTADHNGTEHELVDLQLSCDNFVAGIGFDRTATAPYRLDGDFKVRYAWRG